MSLESYNLQDAPDLAMIDHGFARLIAFCASGHLQGASSRGFGSFK